MSVKWSKIERKWRKAWKKARIFETDPDPDKPKHFITVAYPYPNSPQHIGHCRTYTLADVHARYMRMRGYRVLFPMAFHYTGTPILAMSKRLSANDKELIKTFVRIYKVPEERLERFIKPINIARYFHEEIKTGMKKIGYSIDWRREFTTIDPQYNRFIEWQFNKLREAGFLSQGSHPVGWCPNCQNPVGQHDTKGDVEPEIEEFTIIKFRFNEYVLPTATLRPETVFGVTNIWLNPKAEYVKARVNDEKWIISEESVKKLRHLNHRVDVMGTVPGHELIGSEIENPATNEEILILPADFVDPKNATGVVMSVPSHAPYDYVALEELKKEPLQLKEYGIKPEVIEGVNPISIITVPKYSDCPAADVVEQMGIKSQVDANLEKATREVYRHEFHNGTMRKNTGRYEGLSVAEAKERVKADMIRDGKADILYELINKPVICRCGTECVVKIVDDQWFIDYGNPRWKASTHKWLDKMEILPEEIRAEFKYVIDWLHEKACARKAGLGTKLPWDPEWVIESLSDSTIYMAYYVIAKHINEHGIQPNQLSDAVFDYIFLGLGEPTKVSEDAGLNTDIIEDMRKEFTYFYPLDSRHSGRDLVPNHLSFMIFNHTAIFPEELCPRQIVVNGFVMMEGQKMSKSLENILPLHEAIDKFGADSLRISVLFTAELLQDADFNPTLARSMRERLERLHRFAIESPQMSVSEDLLTIDRWMLSRLQGIIKITTEAMNKLKVRKALHNVLYALDRDFRWYLRRIDGEKEFPERRDASAKVFNMVLDAQVRMLAPTTPHICEEIWEKMGRKELIALAAWPTYDEEEVDVNAEENEALIKGVMEDTLNIIKATKITPKKIYYYVAAPWKWRIYLKALDRSDFSKLSLKDLIKELIKDPNLKWTEQATKYSRKILDQVKQMSDDKKRRHLEIKVLDEDLTLKEAKSFLKREFNAEIRIYKEDDHKFDPEKKARFARPYRPAIYIE